MTPAEFVAQFGITAPGFSADVADVLRGMLPEIGYEERGGRIIVDMARADRAPGMGDVIGRTNWIGHRWWFSRPDPGLAATQARAAIIKAINGERLGTRQARFVDYAASEAINRIEGGTV